MRLLIKKSKTKQYLLRLMMISLFFDSYCFTYVGNFPVTLFTILSVALIVYALLHVKSILRKSNSTQLMFGLLFVFIVFVNLFLTSNNGISKGNNTMSAFQAVYFVIIFILSQRMLSSDEIEREIGIFQKAVNIAALYGIIQIALQLIGFSGDLWIPGHMVLGYNWTANGTGLIGTTGLHRAHAFFREPSIYSQFLAVNILIYMANNPRKNMRFIVLNALAILVSMSGTGILLVAIGLIYFLIVSGNRKLQKYGLYSVAIGLAALVLLYVFANDIFMSLYLRAYEIFGGSNNVSAEMIQNGWTTSSGFVRFIGVWRVQVESMKEHFWLGCGIGTGEEFVRYLNYGVRYTLDNGFVRVAVELGVIGVLTYIGLIVGGMKEKRFRNSTLIVVVFIAMNFLNNTFSQNYFWGLMAFFNMVSINNKDLGEVI